MKADPLLRVLIAASLVAYVGLGAALVYGIYVEWVPFTVGLLIWACFGRPLIRDARKDWYV